MQNFDVIRDHKSDSTDAKFPDLHHADLCDSPGDCGIIVWDQMYGLFEGEACSSCLLNKAEEHMFLAVKKQTHRIRRRGARNIISSFRKGLRTKSLRNSRTVHHIHTEGEKP